MIIGYHEGVYRSNNFFSVANGSKGVLIWAVTEAPAWLHLDMSNGGGVVLPYTSGGVLVSCNPDM
jgi:hypothetical protein